jgi:hypothetical protein
MRLTDLFPELPGVDLWFLPIFHYGEYTANFHHSVGLFLCEAEG